MSQFVRSLSLVAVLAFVSAAAAAQESGHDLALGLDPAAERAGVKLYRLDGADTFFGASGASLLPSAVNNGPVNRLHWGGAAAPSDRRDDRTLDRLLDLDKAERDMTSDGGFADIDVGTAGGLLLGFVQNRWADDHGMSVARETVVSGSADFRLHLGGVPVSVASELAYYSTEGEDGTGGLAVAASNLGYSLKLANPRAGERVGYGLLFEYYGEDFRPHGAEVDPDRMQLRLDGSWRTAGGLKLSGYAGRVVTGLGAENRTEKLHGGMVLGRKFDRAWLSGLDVQFGVDVERSLARGDDKATLSRGARLRLSAPMTGGFRSRVKLHAKQIDEASKRARKTVTGVDAGVEREVRLFGLDGRVSADVIARSTANDDGETLEQGARVEASLNRGPQRFELSGSLLGRSADDKRLGRKLALRWLHDAGDYSIGLEAEHHRAVDDDEAAYLAGVFVNATF